MNLLTTVPPRGGIDFIDLKEQYCRLKPAIDQRIQRVLDHGQFIMGPEVAELEEALADYIGVSHCIGVADGTTALLVAMMALEIGRGDEVITTPFTFVATAEMISLLGATPVFVDIDPVTCNLDPNRLEEAIGPRTRAIVPVSLYGQCADMDAINAIASKHALPVIEDAAQSFGSEYKGRRSAGLSTVGCTSFFPSKPLGCYGDGGACFTNDAVLAGRMRQIRVHGQVGRYVHTTIGINGRLDTLQAAILLAKFTTFPEEVRLRAESGARYTRLINSAARLAGATPPRPVPVAAYNTSVYAQYTVRLSDRERVIAFLTSSGIPVAVHYPVCLHKQPVYAASGYASEVYPNAEKAAAEVMSLPMHPHISDELQRYVVSRVVEAVCAKA